MTTEENQCTTAEPRGTKRLASDLSSSKEQQEPEQEPQEEADTKSKTVSPCQDETDRSHPTDAYQSLHVHGEHKRAVSCVSFAPTIKNVSSYSNNDPIVCASACADGTVRLWDITQYVQNEKDKEEEEEEQQQTDPWRQPQRQPSNSRMLTPVGQISGHARGINDVAWSPRTPNLIATASDDKTLRIWDVTRSQSIATANVGVGPSVDTSTGTTVGEDSDPDNANTVGQPSAGTGSAPHIFNESLVEFKGHSNFCFSVKFSPQGNLLVSGSFDETVKIWDVRTGECVSTLPAHSDPVTGVDFNRDGTCIVSSSHDGLMRIWDVASGECLKTIYADGNPPVTFVRYSPNGKYVLSGMLDGKLRLWNVVGGKDYQSMMPESLMAKQRSKDYLSIGLSTVQGKGGLCTKTYSGHVNSKYCIFSAFAVANPDRQSIVTGSEDGKIHIYDLQTRKTRQVLNGHKDACLAVAAHDSKELLASGGMTKDRLVKFWVPDATASRSSEQ